MATTAGPLHVGESRRRTPLRSAAASGGRRADWVHARGERRREQVLKPELPSMPLFPQELQAGVAAENGHVLVSGGRELIRTGLPSLGSAGCANDAPAASPCPCLSSCSSRYSCPKARARTRRAPSSSDPARGAIGRVRSLLNRASAAAFGHQTRLLSSRVNHTRW